MKKSELKNIIKEEIQKILKEEEFDDESQRFKIDLIFESHDERKLSPANITSHIQDVLENNEHIDATVVKISVKEIK